jgi:hypothetical protein
VVRANNFILLPMSSLARRSTGVLGTLSLVILTVFAILIAGNEGSNQPGQPESLYAGMPPPQARYGAAIATDGDVVLVGSPQVLGRRSFTGAAYVFTSTDAVWSPNPLEPSTAPSDGDLYGASVAVDGSIAVVGAPGTDQGQGAAYVFIRSGDEWIPEAVLKPTAASGYGTSVAVSGETIVVGAPGTGPGAAFVYTRSDDAAASDEAEPSSDYGWVETRLISYSGISEGAFGTSVAADGDLIVVGAPNESAGAGTVTVFATLGDEWRPLARFSLPGLGSLGAAIDLDLPYLVAGAPTSAVDHGEATLPSAGRVLVWTRTEDGAWTDPTEPFSAHWEPSSNARLGRSVAAANGTVAAAMDASFPWGDLTGVFVIVANMDRTGDAAPLVYGQIPNPHYSQGTCVDIAGNLLVVGAPKDDGAQWMNIQTLGSRYPASGSAWVFHIDTRDGTP